MSIEIERETLPCGVCGARVHELRRGRCWGCYSRWAELRPVGRGAACAICHERRRDHLRLIEVHNRSLPSCHTCAAKVVKLFPVPETIEGIRQTLRRDRRACERRGAGVDQRIFPRERRVGDRRRPPRAGGFADTDPAILLAAVDDLVIEIGDGDMEVVEATQVRERPRPPGDAA
jgi:hypothetical protein